MSARGTAAVPRCLVIIPDGNRRWARQHGYPVVQGHVTGLRNARTIAEAALRFGVEHVVLWAASESNLRKRSAQEVENLFKLLKEELRYQASRPDESADFHLCGAWRDFTDDADLIELSRQAAARNKAHTQTFTVLFGYSGTTELVRAAQEAARDGAIDEASIRAHLWTAHVPDVDLLIRTGVEGDPHWSDLLLPWQMRGTQLIFSNVLWPAFTVDHLKEAFEDLASRARRAGA